MSAKEIQVEVLAVMEERVSKSPIVLLMDKSKDRLLPILIGELEANSIMISLYQVKTPRPLTHQLMSNIFSDLNCELAKIVISKMEKNTFYAEIQVLSNDQLVFIDARPSDAIALALEARVPIFVDEKVMNKSAQPNPFKDIAAKFFERTHQAASEKIPKASFSEEELEKLKELLQKAREREEKK